MIVRKEGNSFWLPATKPNSDDYLRMSKCRIQGRAECSRLRKATVRKAGVIQCNSLSVFFMMDSVSLDKKSIIIFTCFYLQGNQLCWAPAPFSPDCGANLDLVTGESV